MMGKVKVFQGLTARQFNEYVQQLHLKTDVCVASDGVFGFRQYRVTSKYPELRKTRSSPRFRRGKKKPSTGPSGYKKVVYRPWKSEVIRPLRERMAKAKDVLIPFGMEYAMPGLVPNKDGEGGTLYDHSTCFHFNSNSKELHFWDINMNNSSSAAYKRFEVIKPVLVPILQNEYGLQVKRTIPRFVEKDRRWP